MTLRHGVVHYVWQPGAYVGPLVEGLQQRGLRVILAPKWFSRNLYRVLTGPLLLIWLRIRGFRVLNFHFAVEMFKPLSVNFRFGKALFYLWYLLFLNLAQMLGFKMVWTAHNVMPKIPLFNNDEKGRQVLVSKCDLLISTNESASQILQAKFDPDKLIYVPPMIKQLSPSIDRLGFKESLGIASDRLVFSHLGRLSENKGTHLILEALTTKKWEATFIIMGSEQFGSAEHLKKLHSLAQSARVFGNDVRFEVKYISDDELANLFLVSDFLVYPLTEGTNSGILSHAFTLGTPVIIPDRSDLDWIRHDAAIRFHAQDAVSGLAQAITFATEMDSYARHKIIDAGHSMSTHWNLPYVSERYESIYKDLLSN